MFARRDRRHGGDGAGGNEAADVGEYPIGIPLTWRRRPEASRVGDEGSSFQVRVVGLAQHGGVQHQACTAESISEGSATGLMRPEAVPQRCLK